ncbi:MAG: type IV pilin protein [Proteobacteria bacterium]|nr:type IV pilin protein [Pseudomonadota bacterium]
MNHFNNSRSIRGFTLIELMIVLAIVALLASVGYPAYQESIQKSRRADAKIALVKAAASEERWFTTNNAYTSNASNVGGALSPEGFYDVTVIASTLAYALTVTANGAQLDDTDCRTFTITQTGLKSSTDSASAASTECW